MTRGELMQVLHNPNSTSYQKREAVQLFTNAVREKKNGRTS
jgi:hypothetical protein